MTRRPLRRRSGLRHRAAALLSGALVAVVAAVAVGAVNAHVAAYVPGLPTLLHLLSRWLPGQIAWVHDEGTPRMRSGAYLGWTNGEEGELYLYGEGCEGTDSLVTLRGPSGTAEVAAGSVQALRYDLPGTDLGPVLRLVLALDRTATFDRAVLRCRDGTESHARIAATVIFVPPDRLLLGTQGGSEGLAHGLSPARSLGFVGELNLVAGAEPVVLRSLFYTPSSAGTGFVAAAAGHRNARETWRWQVAYGSVPTAPSTEAAVGAAASLPAAVASGKVVSNPRAAAGVSVPPAPSPLSAWHSGYASLSGPRSLMLRPAHDLNLLLYPQNTALVVATQGAYRTTARPRPLLAKFVLEFEHAGQRVVLVPEGLAFGWTAQP